ncbi:hypothetical protein BN1723_003612 [Verticillium longisporum]|uniref:Uncharacterized protein n=1 Tax=Verticillium longisporum TaxID=100787 RepID=A0A0G4M636_VERLO|nr:hypothetical protein BN1723_003612 [Verticillium longisporum]
MHPAHFGCRRNSIRRSEEHHHETPSARVSGSVTHCNTDSPHSRICSTSCWLGSGRVKSDGRVRQGPQAVPGAPEQHLRQACRYNERACGATFQGCQGHRLGQRGQQGGPSVHGDAGEGNNNTPSRLDQTSPRRCCADDHGPRVRELQGSAGYGLPSGRPEDPGRPRQMRRDVEFLVTKLGKVDGFETTGEHLTSIINSKQVEAPAQPAQPEPATADPTPSSATVDAAEAKADDKAAEKGPPSPESGSDIQASKALSEKDEASQKTETE